MLHARPRPVPVRRPLHRGALPALLLVAGGGSLVGLGSQASAASEEGPDRLEPAPVAAAPAWPVEDTEYSPRATRSRSLPLPAPVVEAPPPPPPPPPAPVVEAPPEPSPSPSPKPKATRKPTPSPAPEAEQEAAPTSSGGACPVPAASFTDTWGAPRSGGRTHKGTDMMAPSGSPVYAVADGVVKTASSSAGGISLYLTADNGTIYFYAHNSSNVASSGERVSAGDLVAKVGSTGNASGGSPHVHFEMQPGGGAAVNPYRFLRGVC